MKERRERRGTHLSAERNEGLDEHCRLGGHVQAASDAGSLRERKVQRRTSELRVVKSVLASPERKKTNRQRMRGMRAESQRALGWRIITKQKKQLLRMFLVSASSRAGSLSGVEDLRRDRAACLASELLVSLSCQSYLEGLGLAVQAAEVHQTGHLVLREHDVLTTSLGELDVGCGCGWGRVGGVRACDG
jgi:hypothetical protein